MSAMTAGGHGDQGLCYLVAIEVPGGVSVPCPRCPRPVVSQAVLVGAQE